MSEMVVNAYKGVIDSAVAKLKELMTGDMCANLIGVSSRDILFLRDELPAMNALLEKLDDAEELDPETKNWRHQVRERWLTILKTASMISVITSQMLTPRLASSTRLHIFSRLAGPILRLPCKLRSSRLVCRRYKNVVKGTKLNITFLVVLPQ